MPFIAFLSDEPFDLTQFVADGTFPTPEAAEQFRLLLYNAWHDAISDEVSQVPGLSMTPTAATTYTRSNPSS